MSQVYNTHLKTQKYEVYILKEKKRTKNSPEVGSHHNS